MLRAAIVFFVIALLAMVLGAGNVAGVSMELGKTLLIVFLVLAVLSFLANMVGGRGSRPLSLGAAILIPFLAASHPARADESTTEKATNQADQAKVDAQKAQRDAQKKKRNATDQKNVAKDAGDAASNVGDDISHEAKKTKNKVD